MRTAFSPAASRPAAISFSRGVPPDELIPSAALAAIARRLLDERPAAFFQYAPLHGYHGDPVLIAELGRRYGVSADEIFVGNGSLQVVELLARSLFDIARPTIIAEAPTYDRSLLLFKSMGARVLPIDLQPDGPDLDQLRDHLAVSRPSFIYLIPDFQNPSGVTTSLEKRREIARLVADRDIPIIEDTPYRDLSYAGAPPPLIRDLEEAGAVFTVSSLSKVLSPGLRIGFVLGPPREIGAIARLATNVYLSPPPLTQAIAGRALSEGLSDRTVEAAIAAIGPRCVHAVERAHAIFGDGLVCEPTGGYFLSCQIQPGLDEADFLARSADCGLTLTRGSAFVPDGSAFDRPDTIFLRLPFHSIAEDDFAEGIDRLGSLIGECQQRELAPCN